MAIKFSELLDSGRLRPLWQRGTALARTETEGGSDEAAAGQDGAPNDLGPPRLTLESPHTVLGELEEALRANLGADRLLVVHLVHPLRAAVRRMDGGASALIAHPLEEATTGDVFTLIDKLDDTLAGLIKPAR
jgi:hypothetical protein